MFNTLLPGNTKHANMKVSSMKRARRKASYLLTGLEKSIKVTDKFI